MRKREEKLEPKLKTLKRLPMGKLCRKSFKALTAKVMGVPLIDPLLSIRKM